MNFGQWLEDQLNRQNLTRADLARLAHVSERSVYNWLAGKRVPYGATRHLLEMVLKAEYKEVHDGQVEEEMRPARGT